MFTQWLWNEQKVAYILYKQDHAQIDLADFPRPDLRQCFCCNFQDLGLFASHVNANPKNTILPCYSFVALENNDFCGFLIPTLFSAGLLSDLLPKTFFSLFANLLKRIYLDLAVVWLIPSILYLSFGICQTCSPQPNWIIYLSFGICQYYRQKQKTQGGNLVAAVQLRDLPDIVV